MQDRLGVDVIIYSNGFYSNTYYESDLASFDLWFAAPNGLNNPPSSSSMGIWNEYAFWQYSWTESIGGESPVDANVFDGTVQELQQYIVGSGVDPVPQVDGDYNSDGIVDAADYTVWRDEFPAFNVSSPADGDGNRIVNSADYDFWVQHYGEAASAEQSLSIPEPGAIVLLMTSLVLGCRRS